MAICIAYLGVGAVAIPTGIISAGFVEQYQRKSSISDIKNADINIYSKLRLGILGRAVNLPGAGGRNIIIAVYHVAQKFYGFN